MTPKSDVRTRVAVAATPAIVLAPSATHAEISKRDMQVLSKSQLIYIATVRKDRNQSKAAPVWFTLSADKNGILIQTGPNTWKAKRIRRGSPVLVWIGTADGPAFIGRAEITSDVAVQKKILDDFREKYWQNRMLGMGPSRAKFDNGNRVAIVITPTRDLPGGFISAPGTPPPLKMPATGKSALKEPQAQFHCGEERVPGDTRFCPFGGRGDWGAGPFRLIAKTPIPPPVSLSMPWDRVPPTLAIPPPLGNAAIRTTAPDSRRVRMTLRQEQPVVARTLYQTSAGFHQALLQAGQRPPCRSMPAAPAAATGSPVVGAITLGHSRT